MPNDTTVVLLRVKIVDDAELLPLEGSKVSYESRLSSQG